MFWLHFHLKFLFSCRSWWRGCRLCPSSHFARTLKAASCHVFPTKDGSKEFQAFLSIWIEWPLSRIDSELFGYLSNVTSLIRRQRPPPLDVVPLQPCCRSKGVFIDSPSQSPGLNPTENLWRGYIGSSTGLVVIVLLLVSFHHLVVKCSAKGFGDCCYYCNIFP